MIPHKFVSDEVIGEDAAKALSSFKYTEQKRQNEARLSRISLPYARVLVVDDINTNLKVAEGLLQPYQIQVDLCKSGEEAIEAVKKNRYDIVLMDYMMPVLNGIETTAQIRALSCYDSYYSSLPIIAVTANAVSGTRELFLNSGFNDFLSKPIDILKLNAILKNWLPQDKQRFMADSGDLRDAAAVKEDVNIKIDGVNIKKGISMTGGTIQYYIKMLNVFIRDGNSKLGEIRSSLADDNIPLYVTYVHGLKSASAIIGADKLSEDSKLLEIAGKQGDLLYIRDNTGALLADLEALLTNINKALADVNPDKQTGAVDSERLSKILTELGNAMESFDLIAINQWANMLQEYAQTDAFGETITNIINFKLTGEFESALSLINGLLIKLYE